MKECKYKLGYFEFQIVYHFSQAYEDRKMRVNKYMERIREMGYEAGEEAIKEGISDLESVRRFGEIMSKFLEGMRSHVMSCDECMTKYRDFVESERLYIRLTGTLKLDDVKKTEDIDSINPDFLGLYDH